MAYNSIGGNNGAVDADHVNIPSLDLFKEKMTTDVLRYFQSTNIGKALITNKSIDNGKSESFNIVGESSAEFKDNGSGELDERTIKHTERIIMIEGLLVSHSYITDLDNAMVHYDAKAAHTESIGRALGKKFDTDLFLAVETAGALVDPANYVAAGLKPFDDDTVDMFVPEQTMTLGEQVDGAKVYNVMADIIAQYEDKDIVGEGTFVLRPESYYALLNNSANTGLTWINDEYTQSGKVPLVLGKRVMKSPHLKKAGAALASGDVIGHFFSKEAIGCLELISQTVGVDYIPTRLAWLIVGKMAIGFGILNPKCAVNIKVA